MILTKELRRGGRKIRAGGRLLAPLSPQLSFLSPDVCCVLVLIHKL